MRSLLICMPGFAMFALPTLARAEKPKEFLAVYSNMCIHPESGDLLGERMIVFRSGHPVEKEDVWMLYQSGEGVLSKPIFELAAIDGDDIRFALHFPYPPNPVRTFVGKITPAAISGRYTDTNVLARSCSCAKPTRRTDSRCALARAGPSGGKYP